MSSRGHLAKGPSIHQTDSSAPRPAPIISVVNTRPESSAWQRLNRTAPKRQNRTSWQPPGFDMRGLVDAYLIVSLENLVEVSKRLPVCAHGAIRLNYSCQRRELGPLCAPRSEWA